MRAIRDVNVPKFLQDDLKLFNGIVSDLFPKIREQPIDYGNLEGAIGDACLKQNIEAVPGFVTKCIQLYETTVVRHGLMLVGPTGSGKTKVFILYTIYCCHLHSFIYLITVSVSSFDFQIINNLIRSFI